ncbi:MAG TPA: BatA domain-containing protein [Pirellulales bacterium]|nr:BatA domain-containing protein [Pirellulales bacterium]
MIQLPALFAVFNHPVMLAWLAAAAAPLVIHLLNRRKHREMPWAAMQYLMAAIRKSSRRVRIEQWLLLAIRTLLVVLLVLAMAEPVLEQTGLTLVAGQRTHKVLVIDGSYSMAYKAADQTRFQRAKELAARIVEDSRQGDGFTLVLMAEPPRVLVGTPALEPHEFLQEIDQLQLVDEGADLSATLIKVEEILAAARREQTRLAREEIYFLTDLGRTTWAPELRGSEAVSEFRRRSQKLASSATVVVADLGQSGAENTAIVSCRAVEPYVTAAREATLEAEIRNFGRQERPGYGVELYVDGRRAGETQVDLQPEGTGAASFNYRFDAPGEHQIEFRLAGDQLDIDDHRWLSLPVVRQLRVLCVDGRPGGGAFEGAADYLLVALSPRGPTDDRSAVRPEVVPESALLELDLEPYDAVFLCNVGQFTPNEARVLESYVKHGGGLVCFLGDQVRAESYNRQLSPDGVGVLPVRLGETVEPKSPAFLDPLDYEHPLTAPFRGRESAGLLKTPVRRYIKLQLPEDSPAKTAIKFTGGDPAVVEQKTGRGRSIIVATSADRSWTAMPLGPGYLPIVQELLAEAVRGRIEQRNQRVGQPLGEVVRSVAVELPVTIQPPEGDPQTVRIVTDGRDSRWSYTDVGQSGFYRAEIGPPISKSELFALNVDTAESDLAKLDLDELRNDVWPGVPFETFDGQNPVDAPTAPIVRRDSLHQWILWAVFGLLLAEVGVACAFGRRSL